MKVRPQTLIGLFAVGCMGVAGIHFADAQAPRGTKLPDRPDSVQQQQRDAAQRGTRTRNDRARIEGRSRTAVRATTHIRSSVFIGAPVSLSGGASLGTVQEIVFGDGGCVDYVIVNYDNRLVPVPWAAGSFRATDRAFLLTIEESQLTLLPTFTDFAVLSDATFVAKVDTFFKVDARTRDRRDRDGKADTKKADADKADSDKSDAGKSEPDKTAPEADGKQPEKSPATTPRTQRRTEPKAGAPNRGAESKKVESPAKSAEPKADPSKATKK